MNKYQVDLVQGTSRLTCWVDKAVQPGNMITLRNSPHEGWWSVVRVSDAKAADKIYSTWKVGGI